MKKVELAPADASRGTSMALAYRVTPDPVLWEAIGYETLKLVEAISSVSDRNHAVKELLARVTKTGRAVASGAAQKIIAKYKKMQVSETSVQHNIIRSVHPAHERDLLKSALVEILNEHPELQAEISAEVLDVVKGHLKELVG